MCQRIGQVVQGADAANAEPCGEPALRRPQAHADRGQIEGERADQQDEQQGGTQGRNAERCPRQHGADQQGDAQFGQPLHIEGELGNGLRQIRGSLVLVRGDLFESLCRKGAEDFFRRPVRVLLAFDLARLAICRGDKARQIAGESLRLFEKGRMA